jgi:hypothetical protein
MDDEYARTVRLLLLSKGAVSAHTVRASARCGSDSGLSRSAACRRAYLGPDTPVESLEEAARRTDPSVVVLSSVRSQPLEQLAALATRHRVAIAGAGAASARLKRVERLTTDPVTAAERLTT